MTTPHRLAAMLVNKGAVPPGWQDTIEQVDRAVFLPQLIEVRGRVIDRAEQPTRWNRMAYGDLPLITQINDGTATGSGDFKLPTSSSSMPSVMLEMLDLLDPHDGDQTMELGTGTGYNAALLCHRLGEQHVTTVETDKTLYDTARANLADAGHHPRLIHADGAGGHPDRAPYARILATYTVRHIPPAWITQTRPGGRIVTPWGASGLHGYSFAVLNVNDTKEATGRFTGTPAFMWDRTARPGGGHLADWIHHEDDGQPGTTRIDPVELHHAYDTARFHVALQVPDAWTTLCAADDGSDEHTLWVFSDDGASWATAEHQPGTDTFETDQYGPRRLWDEIETAHQAWQEHGRPHRDRYGLTATADGRQAVWLDEPDNIVAQL